MKMGKGMGSGMPDMKDTQPPGMKGMEMGTKGMEMGMKGREMMGGKGMAGMKTPAALPAFPGTSHIYHIGATGFFLDHPERHQADNRTADGAEPGQGKEPARTSILPTED